MDKAPQAIAFELLYLDKAREDEALVRQLPPANLPEYAIASQYHRIGEQTVRIAGVLLEQRQTATGIYTVYRDPMTGDIYKTNS